MESANIPPPPDYAALAQRLGLILGALAALIARAFLRRPKLAGLIVPLWQVLTHIAPRFARALTQAPRAARAPRHSPTPAARKPAMRLPSGRGWLVRELGYEGVAYMSQLQHLLDDPEMRAALTAMPAAQRVLRSVCRMLGVPNLPAPAPAAVALATGGVRPDSMPAAPAAACLPGDAVAGGGLVLAG